MKRRIQIMNGGKRREMRREGEKKECEKGGREVEKKKREIREKEGRKRRRMQMRGKRVEENKEGGR